ncbi:unnamed protein product [Polarella glacialis]|uniref:60S ribosomal protein L35 n=1 Tax=Polarella glacialis TaxID=89957 RepID=A0A813LKM5_POLGL|nr:unnamed protein product [Polarella glacialis]
MAPVKAYELRSKTSKELLKELDDMKGELAQLRVAKVAGGAASKLAKIKGVRKGIARILTVYNQKQKAEARKQYKGKKYMPLDLRPKKTRKIRRALKTEQKYAKTLRQKTRESPLSPLREQKQSQVSSSILAKRLEPSRPVSQRSHRAPVLSILTTKEEEEVAEVVDADNDVLEDEISGLISTACWPCLLEPCGFVVAWSGVLALRFSGFPPALAMLKERLEKAYGGLPKESPGSRWPKSTLAAVVDGQRLDPRALETLRLICLEAGERLRSRLLKLELWRLSAVIYESRSLERRIATTQYNLHPSSAGGGTAEKCDESRPFSRELQSSDAVEQETLADGYWLHASKDGNRESHYRGGVTGATLVWDFGRLSGGANDTLAEEIQRFQQEVEKSLPGLYCFFKPQARHMTVRALAH